MNPRSNLPANRSMPPGTIIPELGYPDTDSAAAWLCAAFGFQQRLRIGSHRFQLVFGDASVVVVAKPAAGGLTDSIMVAVENVDAHYTHASRHGARILNPPADYPFGERQYTAEDPAGRRWTFSQSIADVDPSDWGGQLPAARKGPA
jgi:uncharacterized glyoxalase superfamily protein PhnB